MKHPAKFGSETIRWTVFDKEGASAVTLDRPAGLRVLHVTPDYILTVWADETDLECVRSYRIDESPGR